MGVLVSEHGGAIRTAIIGAVTITILFIGLNLLNGVMPVFNKEQNINSQNYIKNRNEHLCSMDAAEVVYIDYKCEISDIKKYLVANKYVCARDYDGKDLSENLEINGSVDTNVKGLYTLYLQVKNSFGNSVKKKINIIVEE